MGLSAREQQELDSIEDEIAGSAPGLARLLATFTRLTAGEELPAREQVKGASRRRGRRRPTSVASRRHGGPALPLSLAAVLLWLAVSVALIVPALVLSRGGNGKGCALPGAACAGQAPGHAARPARPSAAGLARATPHLPGSTGRYCLLHGRGPLALVPAWDDLPAAPRSLPGRRCGHAQVR